jgi:hypothetical protein
MTDFDKDDKFWQNRFSDDHTVNTDGSHTVDAESDIIHEVMDNDSLDMMLDREPTLKSGNVRLHHLQGV